MNEYGSFNKTMLNYFTCLTVH